MLAQHRIAQCSANVTLPMQSTANIYSPLHSQGTANIDSTYHYQYTANVGSPRQCAANVSSSYYQYSLPIHSQRKSSDTAHCEH